MSAAAKAAKAKPARQPVVGIAGLPLEERRYGRNPGQAVARRAGEAELARAGQDSDLLIIACAPGALDDVRALIAGVVDTGN